MNKNELEKKFSKNDILKYYLAQQKKLAKEQREYKTTLSSKQKSREEIILDSGCRHTNSQLRLENNELQTQIWVASGESNQRVNQRYLKNIKCHVKCQEHLEEQISQLKVNITNMEHEIGHLNKKLLELNKKIVPEPQHQANVRRVNNTMHILENKLLRGMGQECLYTGINADLREELLNLLHERTAFNNMYTTLIENLNSNKKYIIELVEYAMGKFDHCIAMYEQIDIKANQHKKENNNQRGEVFHLERARIADEKTMNFMQCKGKERVSAEVHPKEQRRRNRFREKHDKKLSLYKNILKKIEDFSKLDSVESVIEKYEHQRGQYDAYFNYANDMSYHITSLNETVNSLYTNINDLKHTNEYKVEKQYALIENLEKALKEKQDENSKLEKYRDENYARLENLLQGIEAIFVMSNADAKPLKELVGKHDFIDVVNIRRFCQVLERRLLDITASVYIMERQKELEPGGKYVVREINKFVEDFTDLDAIVLTQQCAECAEIDALNDDPADAGTRLSSVGEVKKNLRHKVVQPDMQYRLHNLSQCRLPRCRLLAAKRNV